MHRQRVEGVFPKMARPGQQKTAGAAALELVPGADPYIAQLVRQYDGALARRAGDSAADRSRQASLPEWFPPVRKPH